MSITKSCSNGDLLNTDEVLCRYRIRRVVRRVIICRMISHRIQKEREREREREREGGGESSLKYQ